MAVSTDTSLDQFVQDSNYLIQRLRIVNRATDMPSSVKFDLARSSLSDTELESVARSFGAPDRNGWGFASLLQDVLSRDPRSIAVGDLRQLQTNLKQAGYVSPDTPVNGVWDPAYQAAFSRFDSDSREKAISGGHWMATSAQSAMNFMGSVLPTNVFQSLVGQAKGLITSAPETAERLGAGGGALAGAAIGASVASVIPGAGTLAGGLVGGAIGGAVGFFADLFGHGEGEGSQSGVMSLVDPFIPQEYWTERQGAQKFWQDVGWVATVASVPQTVGLAAKGIGAAAALAKTATTATEVGAGLGTEAAAGAAELGAEPAAIGLEAAPAVPEAAAAVDTGTQTAAVRMTGWLGRASSVETQPSWWTRWLAGAPAEGKPAVGALAKTLKGGVAGAVATTTAQALEAETTGLTKDLNPLEVAAAGFIGGALAPWLMPGSLAQLMTANRVAGVMALKETQPIVKAAFGVYTGLSAQGIAGRYLAGIGSGDYRTPLEKAIKEAPTLPAWTNLAGFALFPEQWFPVKLGDVVKAFDATLGDGHLEPWVNAWQSLHPGSSRKVALAAVKEALGPDDASQRLSLGWLKMQNGIRNLAMDRVVKSGLTMEDARWLGAYNQAKFDIQRELLSAAQDTGKIVEGPARDIVDEWGQLKKLDAIAGTRGVLDPKAKGGIRMVPTPEKTNELIERMRKRMTSGTTFSNEGEGGFTIDLATGRWYDAGDPALSDTYSVAMTHGMGQFGEVGRPSVEILSDPLAFRAHVQEVISKNYPLLQQKNAMLGGWIYDGHVYIEPISLVKGEEKALREAGLRGMKAATRMSDLQDVNVPEDFTHPSIIGEVMAASELHPAGEEAFAVGLHTQGSDLDSIRGFFEADRVMQDVQRGIQEGGIPVSLSTGSSVPADWNRTMLEGEVRSLQRRIKNLEKEASQFSGLSPAEITSKKAEAVKLRDQVKTMQEEIKGLKQVEERDLSKVVLTVERLDTPTRDQIYQYAKEYKQKVDVLKKALANDNPTQADIAMTDLRQWLSDRVSEGVLTDQWAAKARKGQPSMDVHEYLVRLGRGAAKEVKLPSEYMDQLKKLGYKPVLAGGEVLRPNNLTWLSAPSAIGDLTRRRYFWESLGLGVNRMDDHDLLKLRKMYQESELNSVATKHKLELDGADIMKRLVTALRVAQEHKPITTQNVLEALRATPSIQEIASKQGLKHVFADMAAPVDLRQLKPEQIAKALDDVLPGGQEMEVARDIFAAMKRGAAFGSEWSPVHHPLETARALGHAMRLNGLPGFADMIRTWHTSAPGQLNVEDTMRNIILKYSPDPELAKIASRTKVEEVTHSLAVERGWKPEEEKLAMMMLDGIARGAVDAMPAEYPTLKSFYDKLDVQAMDNFAQLSGKGGYLLQTRRLADEFPEVFKDWAQVDIPGLSPHYLPTVNDLVRSALRGEEARAWYDEGQYLAAYHLSHGFVDVPGGQVTISVRGAAGAEKAGWPGLGEGVRVVARDGDKVTFEVPGRQMNAYELWTNFVAHGSQNTPTNVNYRLAMDALIGQVSGNDFHNWGPSLVRNEDGSLKMVLHGSDFGGEALQFGHGDEYNPVDGIWFSDSEHLANEWATTGAYAMSRDEGPGPAVYAAFLDIRNPFEASSFSNRGDLEKLRDAAKASGFEDVADSLDEEIATLNGADDVLDNRVVLSYLGETIGQDQSASQATEILSKAGFDGYHDVTSYHTDHFANYHTQGLDHIADPGGKAHNVWVPFKKSQIAQGFSEPGKYFLGRPWPEDAPPWFKQAMENQLHGMREASMGFTADLWPDALKMQRFKEYNFYRNHMEREVPPLEGLGITPIGEEPGVVQIAGWHGTYLGLPADTGATGATHFGTRRSATARVSGSNPENKYVVLNMDSSPIAYTTDLKSAQEIAELHGYPTEVGYNINPVEDAKMIPTIVQGKFLGTVKPLSDGDANSLTSRFGKEDQVVWDDLQEKWITRSEALSNYDGVIYTNAVEGIGEPSVAVFDGRKIVRGSTFTEESMAWTGDRHFWRRFGFDSQASMLDKEDRLYLDAVDSLMQKTAKKLGWTPKQVQAALWHDMRAWTDEMATRASEAGATELAAKFRKWSSSFGDARNFAGVMKDPAGAQGRLPFLKDVLEAHNQMYGNNGGFIQLQRIGDEVLGAMKFGDDFRAAIRFFKSANPGTLTHEYGHLLRRLLTEDQMSVLGKAMGFDLAKGLSPAEEERFTDTVMQYFKTRRAEPAILTPLETLRRSLSEQWARFRGFAGSKGMIHPDITQMLDKWFGDVLPRAAGSSLAPGAKSLLLGAAGGAAVGTIEGNDLGDTLKGALAGAAVSKGLRFLAGRNYGYLPEQLMNMSNAIRFTLSPSFDVRRFVKQNLIAGARGNPMFLESDSYLRKRVWDSIYGAGKITGDDAVNEAVTYFDRLYGHSFAKTTDDLDRLAVAQGILGYSPMKRQIAYAYALKQRGYADERVVNEIADIFHYGAGRSSFEKSMNFIFFPFSFEKKLLTNIGNFLLQAPGRNLLIYEGMQRYHEAGFDKHVDEFLNDHLPLLKELGDFNAFAHGISPGQFFLQGLEDKRSGTAKAAMAIAAIMAPGSVSNPITNMVGSVADYGVNAFVPLVLTGESVDRAGGPAGLLDMIGSRYIPFIRDLGQLYQAGADQGIAIAQGESRWSQFRDYADEMRKTRTQLTAMAHAYGYSSMEGLLNSDMGAPWEAMYQQTQMRLADQYPTGFAMSQQYENTAKFNEKALYDLSQKANRTPAEEAILTLAEKEQAFKAGFAQLNLDPTQVQGMMTNYMRSAAAQYVNDVRFNELWDRFFSYTYGPIRRVA